MTHSVGLPVAGVSAAVFRIPTDRPEADGTFAWDSTVLAIVEVKAGRWKGVGYTYADAAVARLAAGSLAEAVEGRDAFDIPALWQTMQQCVRNLGRAGLAATAISALDLAFWDLKARILDLPLALLLGRVRHEVPIYGSGGFTTYTDDQLRSQLSDWVERDGCRFVKMKIGSAPHDDPRRVAVARKAIGNRELFVDANGAFAPGEALRFAAACVNSDIRWFEEPVSSDDLPGLRRVRDNSPDSIDVAAGEYIYTFDDARRLLEAQAVDVLQIDVTRCGGITGFLRIAALADAHHIDISGHCAPAAHRHVACSAPRLRHLEWFHDHVRIERSLFDGAPDVLDGVIRPDLSRPGNGLDFKWPDAEPFRVGGAL